MYKHGILNRLHIASEKCHFNIFFLRKTSKKSDFSPLKRYECLVEGIRNL